MLCNEPYTLTPEAVGRLSPFQAKHCFMVERNKDGSVKLDPPIQGEPEELSLEGEWRDELIRGGHGDPDVIRLVAAARAGG